MDTIKIEVKMGDATLNLQFPEGIDIWEWADQLKTILTFATFEPETINEIVRGKDDDWELAKEMDDING